MERDFHAVEICGVSVGAEKLVGQKAEKDPLLTSEGVHLEGQNV